LPTVNVVRRLTVRHAANGGCQRGLFPV